MRSVTLVLIAVLTGVSLAQSAPPDNVAQAAPSPEGSAVPAMVAPGTVIAAELAKSLDARKAKAGDEVVARVSQDLLAHGEIVIPRGSKIVGHVTSVKGRDKGETQSEIGLAFEKVALKNGREIPLSISIQALGKPVSYVSAIDSATPGSVSGSASGSIGGSAGPGMGSANAGPGTAPSNGNAGDYPGGGVYPPEANQTSPSMQAHGQLPLSAQGVQGMPEYSLAAAPQGSVVSSDKKNVKLDSGTQILLRVKGA